MAQKYDTYQQIPYLCIKISKKGGFMNQMTISANEIQQFVMQTFGNKKITAIAAGNVVLLVADVQTYSGEEKKDTALDKLYGMFKNTSLLSSDEFAKNKRFEKEIEEKKFSHE